MLYFCLAVITSLLKLVEMGQTLLFLRLGFFDRLKYKVPFEIPIWARLEA